MQIKNLFVFNLTNALRGMRNPLQSWAKSTLEADKKLAMKLIKAGPEHAKFMRQIFLSLDITASKTWWKQFDTYKIGVTANSTSTMHTIMKRNLTKEDFDLDKWHMYDILYLEFLNSLREEGKFHDLVKRLPDSYLYTRTVTLNYQVLRNMYWQRKGHKLPEWKKFFDQILGEIPYKEFIDD